MVVEHFRNKLNQTSPSELFQPYGRVTRVAGLLIEARGLPVSLGHRCVIELPSRDLEVEVIGFSGETIYLMPLHDMTDLFPGARIRVKQTTPTAPVGDSLLGRILDGTGEPIDDLGPLQVTEHRRITASPINPLKRQVISQPLDVGIRAINGLLTVGKGQRMGLFAGSGVGKSILLGMMTQFTKADVVVIALIGERGREVRDFIDKNLGTTGLKKSVVVASPADSSPVQRVNGALIACTIAEYFRDQNKDVLLIMDSLTRFAHAKRQIALSLGEPPAHKGYTPSVFSDMAQLVERAGNLNAKGSMTAFYTVLADGDDIQDPVVDAARSFLDGHIILSRHIAEMGIYPAIDIEASISRAMTDIISPDHLAQVLKFKRQDSLYQENKDLIMVGAYQKGYNVELDQSVQLHQARIHYISQGLHEAHDFQHSKNQLHALFQTIPITTSNHAKS